MQTSRANRARDIATALAVIFVIAGCGKTDNPQTAGVPTDQTAQPIVPPPPGDSTPKAVDSGARVVSEANEKAGASSAGSQTTVGTAASGEPPYSLQGAPEGNPAPKDGGEPKK